MMHYRFLAGPLVSAAMLVISAASGRADNVPQPAPQAGIQPTAPRSSGLIDDADPGWIWSGMTEYDDPSLQGGSGHAGGPGSYGAYTFHGAGVEVFGFATSALSIDGRVHKVGRARISIDGKELADVSMAKPDDTYGFNIATVTGLSDSNHVLQIEPTDGWIVVDDIHVLDQARPAVEASDPAKPAATASTQPSAPQAGPITGPTVPDGVYWIALKMNPSKLFSTSDRSPKDGSNAEIDGFSADHQQTWRITSTGGGRYRLSPANAPDEALTVMSTKLKNTGYSIGVWHDTDTPVSQWYIVPADAGYYRFASAASTKQVIDLLWNNTNDGSGLILFDWHHGDNQEWALVPAKQ